MNPAMIDEAQGTRILLSIQRIFEQEAQEIIFAAPAEYIQSPDSVCVGCSEDSRS